MIKNINIKTKSSKYWITIGDNTFKKLLLDIRKYKCKKYIIIDAKILNNFKFFFKKYSENDFNIIKINGSEKIKSINTYQEIIIKLLSKKIDRSSIIIAVGGGTIGDLSGFVASTILRGVKLILVPTTLLSQVDSSIGGKNGINSKFGKNLIGTFYQPMSVVIDTVFLKTLPFREIKSGYAEIIKHAIINDKKFFTWLCNNYENVFKLKNKEIMYAIQKSLKIKAKFVMRDEKEIKKDSSSRAILNFGHTFGHALETLSKYNSNILHGEAISIGMIIASKISHSIGLLPKKDLNKIQNHFQQCGLPINTNLIKNNKFIKVLSSDKKNKNNELNLILIKEIGTAHYAKNFKLEKIKNIIS